ncbi:GNAT family N-acetyltransferase [Candidatus Dependentiae bacterium]|nr:GNAT family N-acetyltransferase [Candidatus Dependentiae bacterium]
MIFSSSNSRFFKQQFFYADKQCQKLITCIELLNPEDTTVPLGSIEIEWHSQTQKGRIEQMNVDPEWQNKGIGSLLFEIGMHVFVTAFEVNKIYWTDEPLYDKSPQIKQRLRRFYEKLGGIATEDDESDETMKLGAARLFDIKHESFPPLAIQQQGSSQPVQGICRIYSPINHQEVVGIIEITNEFMLSFKEKLEQLLASNA